MFESKVYSQNQSVTKLHTSKTVTPQPRVLTPITPKAHIMQVSIRDVETRQRSVYEWYSRTKVSNPAYVYFQSLNLENDAHSNDEVPYPPQYTSPLLHGAVASPPLGSPKISPQPIVSGASNTRVCVLFFMFIWKLEFIGCSSMN